jgi:hypothetical protein
MLHDVWNSLIEGDPHEVAALYRDSFAILRDRSSSSS